MSSYEEQLRPGEQVLRVGRANLQRGAETVGGTLVLTGQRLLFHPHWVNVQIQDSEVPLDRITGVRPAWTKFLGAIPLAPNSILATTADGGQYSFVVSGRARWIAAIEQARGDGIYSGRRSALSRR